MNQAGLTLVVPIKGPLDPLRELLGRVQDDIRTGRTGADKGALLPFADLRTLHFARFTILEPRIAEPGRKSFGEPKLVFATVHDGPRAQHLNELVTIAGEALVQIFALCDNELKDQPRDVLRKFLAKHRKGQSAFWGGHPRRSVAQIHAEAKLHGEVEAMLGASSRRLSGDPLADVTAGIQQRADLHWALSPPVPTRVPWYRKVLEWGVLGLAGIPLLRLALPWVLTIRCLELLDEWRARRAQQQKDPNAQYDAERERERSEERAHKATLRYDEDHHVQNQLSAISEVKPGLVRLVTLRVVLWIVHQLGRALWDRGALHGIRTIHFARWFILKQDDGRRWLVFLSNYDGSWEHYLGEFVDHSATGLTAIWSNTVGFPDARWLGAAGARRELKFKRWVRRQQVETQVWYSAYPKLSVTNVQNNTEIRRGLQGLHGLEERRAWLRRV